jgi:solute carrier family 25 carnitine/acylcarnitine transporter 20/29
MEYLPGFLQGITRVIISYPFDYFRIFKQTNTTIDYVHEIKTINFYKGLSFPLISVPIDRAITFKMYENLKNNKYSTIECSIYPSLISSIYMTPVNLLNTNYVFFKDKTMHQIIRNNFNKNIFRGMFVEILRNNLSSMVYLYTYKTLSDNFNNPFVNGSISSFTLWTLFYPLDTIKVKKFVNNSIVNSNSNSNSNSYYNIIKQNSFKSLYNGIGLVYLRTIPSAGLGMLVYENTKKFIETPAVKDKI